MNSIIKLAAAAAVTFALQAGSALADECSSAQALVDKAIAHYKQAGKDKAYADFMDKGNPEWVNGELYVIVAAPDGMFKVHAVNPKLIDNQDLYGLKDVNGTMIIQEMAKSGKASPGGAWVKYTWTHPVTKKLAPKQTWVKAYDNQLFMVGCYP